MRSSQRSEYRASRTMIRLSQSFEYRESQRMIRPSLSSEYRERFDVWSDQVGALSDAVQISVAQRVRALRSHFPGYDCALIDPGQYPWYISIVKAGDRGWSKTSQAVDKTQTLTDHEFKEDEWVQYVPWRIQKDHSMFGKDRIIRIVWSFYENAVPILCQVLARRTSILHLQLMFKTSTGAKSQDEGRIWRIVNIILRCERNHFRGTKHRRSQEQYDHFNTNESTGHAKNSNYSSIL